MKTTIACSLAFVAVLSANAASAQEVITIQAPPPAAPEPPPPTEQTLHVLVVPRVQMPPSGPRLTWPASLGPPHRLELRATGGITTITESGSFGRAATLFGYRGIGNTLLFANTQWNAGVTGSYSVHTFVRIGGRLMFGGLDAGAAWFDSARLTVFTTTLAPQIEFRVPLVGSVIDPHRLELNVRGTFGLLLGRTDLRGETHVGVGYHGGLSMGIVRVWGRHIVVSFEVGYAWNLWDSGGPVPVQMHGPEVLLGVGYAR